MLTVKEAIEQVDRSKENEETYIPFEEMCSDLFNRYVQIDDENEEHQLKYYWLAHHYCTDSWVGIRVYYLNDDPVCVSHQAGRKCSEDFYWVSKEAADKVREYLLSLAKPMANDNISYAPLDEEMGEGYKVDYSGQLLDTQVMLDGEMVEVINQPQYNANGDMNFHTIDIREQDGTTKSVDIGKILVPWKINHEANRR